jgi:hypothetical protein
MFVMFVNVAKSRFMSAALDNTKESPKNLWSLLNKFLGRQKATPLPSHSDPMKLAMISTNSLSISQFVCVRLYGSTSISNAETPSEVIVPSSLESHSNQLSFLQPVSHFDLVNIIRKTPRKSCLLDPMPTWLVIKVLPSVLPALTKIVNLALVNGMPHHYKEAIVTPLLKKTNLNCDDFSNYRPVSQLSFISKLIERVVAKQIGQHLESNKLMDPMQSAYRSNHSCESTLLYITNSAYSAMDNKQVMLMVFLDLSAAFDTVDHRILSQRLRSCGIVSSIHNWIMDYLRDRRQRVAVNGNLSQPMKVDCGVPQGSVLGE